MNIIERKNYTAHAHAVLTQASHIFDHMNCNPVFDGIRDDEIDKMTLEDFVDYEDKRMQYNVFMTCNDLAFRVQDSPGPRDSLDPMSGLVSETKELFFNNRLFSYIIKCFRYKAE